VGMFGVGGVSLRSPTFPAPFRFFSWLPVHYRLLSPAHLAVCTFPPAPWPSGGLSHDITRSRRILTCGPLTLTLPLPKRHPTHRSGVLSDKLN